MFLFPAKDAALETCGYAHEVIQRQKTVHPAIWQFDLFGLGCQRAAGLMNDDDVYEH
jgi:hypothetical protein